MSASKLPKKGSTVSSKNVHPSTVGTPDANSSTSTVTSSSTNTSNGSLIFITQCTQHLDAAEKALPPGENFTALQKKRGAKNKKGGELFIPQLVALARQHGVDIPLVPLDVIEQNVSEVQALAPLEKQMERLHKQVTDRLFNAQSVSWTHSTALYSVLRRLSKNNGDLQTGLAPVEEFFAARHQSVVTEKTLTRLEAKAAKLAKQSELAKAKSDAVATLVAAKSAAKKKTTAASPVVTPVVEPVIAPAEKPATVTSSGASNGAGAANGATHA